MSALDDLPPDQRATLKLLLCERLRYADVASSLQIDAAAVEARAHAALAALAPDLAQPLSEEARKRVGDLLLGQLADEEAIVSAKLQIAASEAETRWAAALARQLRTLPGAHVEAPPRGQASEGALERRRKEEREERGEASGGPLERRGKEEREPHEPRGQASEQPLEPHGEQARESAAERAREPHGERADAEPRSSGGRLEVSRRGGAALLIMLAAAAAVAIFFAIGGGSGGKAGARNTTAKHETSRSSEQTTTSSGASQTPTLEKQINLTARSGSGSASGVAIIASEEGKKAIVLSVEGLPPTEGFVYYLWLVDSTGKTKPHGYEAPAVTATGTQKGKMSAISLLPKNAAAYNRIELTKQQGTTGKGKKTPPSGPSGEVVLSAAFSP